MDSPVPLMAYDPRSSVYIDGPLISQACQSCSLDQPFVLAENCEKHAPLYTAPPSDPPPDPAEGGGAAAGSNCQEIPETVSPAKGKASSCESTPVACTGGNAVNPENVSKTERAKSSAAAHSTTRGDSTRVDDSNDPLPKEKSAGRNFGRKRQRRNASQKNAASAESPSDDHSGSKGSVFRPEKICKTAKQVSSLEEEPFDETDDWSMYRKRYTGVLGEIFGSKSAKAVRERCNPSSIPFESNGVPSMKSDPAAHTESVKTPEGPSASTADVAIGKKIAAEGVERKHSAQEKTESWPSFSLDMKHSNVVSGFFLSIPSTFSKQFLPHEDYWLTLEDENGFQWRAKFLARRSGLSAGWRRIVLDKKIGVGETIDFLMRAPSHLHFRNTFGKLRRTTID